MTIATRTPIAGAAILALAVTFFAADAQTPPPAAPTAAPPAAPAAPATPVATPPSAPRPRWAENTVIALQPFAHVTTATAAGVEYTLIDLNPNVGGWYVLARPRAGRPAPDMMHIENPLRDQQRVGLDDQGLFVRRGEEQVRCALRTPEGRDLFTPAGQPVSSFCQGYLLARVQQNGYRTTEEAAVSILRAMGSVGESIINLYKTTVGQDANLERAGTLQRTDAPPTAPARGGPRPAAVVAAEANAVFARQRLGIQVAEINGQRPPLRAGQWVRAAAQPDTFVSMLAPRQIDPATFRPGDRANPLDPIESEGIVYMMAFDLAAYTLNYRVGTDHPGVEWSPRPSVQRPSPAGPDGFADIRPLARVGLVPPQERPRLAAVFIGGFKRQHGAFRYGRMAEINLGTHYGFMESGVILSRLQPGLATLFGRLDGSVELRNWTDADNAQLNTLVFARQNGMPIVETNSRGDIVPGTTVQSWGLGNWSGALVPGTDDSASRAELRSVRGAVCLQTHEDRRYMIYAYFSAATPSAMARVFQAYGCSFAMQLDMNSPDLTYAALVAGEGTQLRAEHLNTAMAESEPGRGLVRFLNSNDNRDFFTVLRRAPRS